MKSGDDPLKILVKDKFHLLASLVKNVLIHSHRKRKDSLETRAVLKALRHVEIYRAARNTGNHFKKIWLSPKRMSCLAGNFRANMDKTNADMVQLIKRWNWKWIV